MSRISVDVTFIHADTGMTVGNTLGGKIFVAFSPFPSDMKSRAKWVGLAPDDENVARLLAQRFTEIADQYREKTKKR